MPTITDVCNAAISHCGTRSKISSIDEGSPEANACLNHFTMVRDSSLRAHDWNFARRTEALALLQNPPARWAYKYAIPTDCLRIRRLNDVPLLALPETFYEMATDVDSTGAYVGVLLSDSASVSAIYTAQVTDPLRWDQGFVDAVVYGLASRVCFELTGKEDRANVLTQLWQRFLSMAAAEASNEAAQMNRLYLPETLTARGYDDGTAEIGEAWPIGRT